MGFLELSDKGIYIRVTKREQVLTVDGNRGTNTILEEMIAGEIIFRIWGTGEQANHFKGTREQGSSYPLEGPQLHLVFLCDNSPYNC